MAKIIFEADDNRKGIVDKIFVINKQIVQKGDKIANIITQNKVYEMKAPITGEVQNLFVYENKVINSGDILLDLTSIELTLKAQNYGSDQSYNTISFNNSGKYNVHNRAPIDIKKSETEIFREELIETLLAREVAGEKVQDDFDDTVEFDLPEQNTGPDVQPLSQQNPPTDSFVIKDKVENVIENIPSENHIETLQKDLGDLKEDLATMTIQKEIIEDIENLEIDLTFTAEMTEKKPADEQISDTMIHRMYTDIQEELNQESNEKELLADVGASEVIYFDENLMTEELDEEVILPSLNETELIQHQEKSVLEDVLDESKNVPAAAAKEPAPKVELTEMNKHEKMEEERPKEHAQHLKSHVAVHSHTPSHVKKASDEAAEKVKEHHEPLKTYAPVHSSSPTHVKKDSAEEGKKKEHSEHSKTHATVHSHAASHVKKDINEDIKSRKHSALSHHKTKENSQSLEADQVKLNQQAIIRAKEIMESKRNIAHGFIDIEVYVSELVSLLSIMREAYSQNEIELTLLPFYVKAVYDGLKKFPILNASFISKDHALLLKWFYNIAFNVDSDTTVKMPVLYDLKNSSIKEIASKLTKLIKKTINNELEEADYRDASFSIINYGEYGITQGTFTIPEDNVAGIAMGIIFKKPVVVEKNDIAIRDIMVITLGYNEAVIDITEASKFVHYVAYLLSNPGLLL